MRANAALASVVPRLREVVDGHLVELFAPGGGDAASAAAASAPPDEDPAGAPAPVPLRGVDQPQAGEGVGAAPPRWNLLEQCRLDPARPSAGGYERKSDWRVSTTDPDAALMKTRGQRAAFGYHDHYVVDGGRARVILHALITPADVMENEPMLDQLRRVMFHRKALCKRQVWVEPLFAEAKQWHGLRQFRLRGLLNVNMEGLLVAAGQNLKRWLGATGWGRRHGPTGGLSVTGLTTALLVGSH